MFWFQIDQKHQNRSKNGDLLLLKWRWFLWLWKSEGAYEVKIRQFCSDCDVFAHFRIRRSSGVHRYPYRPHLVTSDFRPPVLWGQNFDSLAIGRDRPQWPQIWYETSGGSYTAMISRRASPGNFYKIGPTLINMIPKSIILILLIFFKNFLLFDFLIILLISNSISDTSQRNWKWTKSSKYQNAQLLNEIKNWNIVLKFTQPFKP